MRRVSIFISIAVSLSLLGCTPAAKPVAISTHPVSINEPPRTNLPAPPSKAFTEMHWTTEDGVVTRLGDLKNKAVVLDFWATNCPPCRAEIPHLNALLAKYGANDLAIVGLHVGDEDDKAQIPSFMADTPINYPVAFPEPELSRVVFSQRDDIPQTLVFDRGGVLIDRIVGFSPEISDGLDRSVAAAVDSHQ